MSIPPSIKASLKRAHQEHVLQYVNANDITDAERTRLYKQVCNVHYPVIQKIASIDFDSLSKQINTSMGSKGPRYDMEPDISPLKEVAMFKATHRTVREGESSFRR